jgi:NAD(P)H-dependent FMN reductase
MAIPPKILKFTASNRAESDNKKLAKYAAICAQDAGSEVTYKQSRS